MYGLQVLLNLYFPASIPLTKSTYFYPPLCISSQVSGCKNRPGFFLLFNNFMKLLSNKNRINTEIKVVKEMIMLYCQNNHQQDELLCSSCKNLTEYAVLRLKRCKFGNAKPFCSNCTVHCYRPEKREEIKKVMRYSGPRMLFRKPFLVLLHYLS